MLERFYHDRRGASSAEYALILAIVGSGLGASAYYLKQAVTEKVGDTAMAIVAESESDSGGTIPPAGATPPADTPPPPDATTPPDTQPAPETTPPGNGNGNGHGNGNGNGNEKGSGK